MQLSGCMKQRTRGAPRLNRGNVIGDCLVDMHSGKLLWNLKMGTFWTATVLFTGPLVRFHPCFPECMGTHFSAHTADLGYYDTATFKIGPSTPLLRTLV